MYPDAASTLLNFDTARTVSSSQQPSSEPTNWADDMDSVARLRDRDCFMRIYDYFMPRLCVYLRGLGHPTPWPRKWRRSACCACGCGRPSMMRPRAR